MQTIHGKTFPDVPPHTCNYTINGECKSPVSLEECRRICESSDLCQAGAYDAKAQRCRPFYSKIYDYVNPLESVVSSDDPKDAVFVDTKEWTYPIDNAGIVRTHDRFYITTDDGYTINTETAGQNVTLTKSGFVATQLLYQDIHGPVGRVELCDSLLINLPGTNMLLRSNGKDGLIWEPTLSDNTGVLDLFTFEPKNQTQCTSDTPLTWDGKYYIRYSGEYLSAGPEPKPNSDAKPEPESRKLRLTTKKYATLWTLTPYKVDMYACTKNQCRPVKASQVKFSGKTGRISGKVVYRSSDCSEYCDPPTEATVVQSSNGSTCGTMWWWIFGGMGLLACVALVILWIKTKKRK